MSGTIKAALDIALDLAADAVDEIEAFYEDFPAYKNSLVTAQNLFKLIEAAISEVNAAPVARPAWWNAPDMPYPGMIQKFENHYGQQWSAKEFRVEASAWAAAWKAALREPVARPVLTNEAIVKLIFNFSRLLGPEHYSDTEFKCRQDVIAFARAILAAQAAL